jgi:transposase-like protein
MERRAAASGGILIEATGNAMAVVHVLSPYVARVIVANPLQVKATAHAHAAWHARPLEATHPLVFFDALRVKIRDEGLVRNKAVHIALGVRADGGYQALDLWRKIMAGAG